jgi:hypothetical protein
LPAPDAQHAIVRVCVVGQRDDRNLDPTFPQQRRSQGCPGCGAAGVGWKDAGGEENPRPARFSQKSALRSRPCRGRAGYGRCARS